MPPSAPTESLGHVFRRPELLRQALTHRSFGADHNERLEFIGDSILNCAIALALYRRFPQLPEGELSRIRANLVNKDTLYRLARTLDLGSAIRLGEGELRSGGASRPSILADALEAMLGAIFLDGGFDAADAAIGRLYDGEIATIDPAGLAKDPKTRLQEWLQGRKLTVPDYEVAAVRGEAHVQTFDVVCRIPALDIAATGSGPSRRAAEQAAAAAAYEQATGA
ncbi:MAG TPA: ribonuclease III [Casimicrobiaceae bacterium]|jgi:ribonuclease-3|nr:ribonuclease III [Casimicrobiaceae bacterium]